MGYLMAVALAEQAQQMLFLERLFITLEAEAVQDITMVESVEPVWHWRRPDNVSKPQ